jgi:hypothetical protein
MLEFRHPNPERIMEKSTAIETVTCARCAGSGSHSFNLMHGSVCYGCNGTGKAYTKRGKAASDYLKALRTVRADSLKVGDLADLLNSGKFRHITEIVTDPEDKRHARRVRDDGSSYVEEGAYLIFCGNVAMGCTGSTLIRKGWNAEEKAAQFKLALEYQDSLTLQGSPRK